MKHPSFYTLTKLAARAELRARGHRFSEINEIVSGIDNDVIDLAVTQTEVTVPTTGAIGDGAIIRSIVEFLKSDLGQALIKALLALLGL